jgi:hypothetical protein
LIAVDDIERQLRQAMSAMVADAEPPPGVMDEVRRRHRRRSAWLVTAGTAIVAAIAIAIPVIGILRPGAGQPGSGPTRAGLVFPGGGRMLLLSRGELSWLYPDGRTVRIGSGFAGAMPAGRKLLAWKHVSPPGASRFLPHGCLDPDCTRIHDLSYYTMNLDGSDPRLVLAAAPPVGDTAFQYEDAQLSPGGSRLAFVSQELRNGTRNIFLRTRELWSLDLATGNRSDLGPATASFAWRDNAKILTGSPDGKSIQLVNAEDGTRTTFLAASNRRLVRAYERARPGAGPPASIGLVGPIPGQGPAAIAVTLGGSATADMLVEGSRVLAFAPGSSRWVLLTMTISPSGVFLLNSQSGNCDCPDLWRNATFAGTVGSRQLSQVQTGLGPWAASAVSPGGTVIAVAYGGVINLVPVPSPACDQAVECLRFPLKQLFQQGTLLAWEP